MADLTSRSPTSSALERLRTQTMCPKCRGRYHQPVLLPCNHSVCKGCLVDVLKKGVRKGLDFIVTCPACSTETELPKTGLDSLPTAFFKQHLSEACSRLEQVEGGKGCEECGNGEARLAGFCRDCERVICSDCRATHQRLRSLSDHTLVGMEDFSRELGFVSSGEDPSSGSIPSPAAPKAETMLCPRHKEPLKMYCHTCHSVICRDCTVGDHTKPRHKVDLVETLIKKHKTDLEGYVASVQDVLSEVRRAAAEKAGIQQSIAEQKTALCSIIHETFQELHQKMEQSKRKLLNEAEKQAAEKTAIYSKELARFKAKASDLESLIEACSEALLHTTDQEFMILRRDLQMRLKEATIRKLSHSPVPTVLPDMFLPISCSQEIESVCKELAHDSLFVSRSKSSVQKVGSATAEVGKEVQLIISTVTKNEKPCIEQLAVEVKVMVPRFERNVEAKVTPSLSLGTYRASFVPTTKGEHLVSVHLEGKQMVASCPYRVVVRSSRLYLGLPQRVLNKKEWAWGVACSSVSRQIYITENFNHCISIWDKDGNHVKNIGHKGQKPGQILSPTGIAVDKEGHIYVADGRENGRIQKLSKTGHLLAIYVELHEPHGVTLNAAEDKVYVCDYSNRRIVVFDTELKCIEMFGELSCPLGQGFPAEETGNLESPHSLAIDGSGNMYVTDTLSRHIHVYSKDGTHLRSISHPHDDEEEFAPTGIAIEDQHIFVADRGGNQVVVFTTTGEFVTATGSYGVAEGQFQNPSGVTMDVDGYLYVCDFRNSRVQVF